MTAARLVLVVAVLAAAVLVGLAWQRRNGRFTAVPTAVRAAAEEAAGSHGQDGGPGADRDDGLERLTRAELGVEPGVRATFVQLSSEVCTPCRRTHAVLADLAAQEDGVRHVDLDVAQHLDLVRRFDVMRTPTVLLLDGAGVVVGRMSGATDRRQALAALEACPPPADRCPSGTTAG